MEFEKTKKDRRKEAMQQESLTKEKKNKKKEKICDALTNGSIEIRESEPSNPNLKYSGNGSNIELKKTKKVRGKEAGTVGKTMQQESMNKEKKNKKRKKNSEKIVDDALTNGSIESSGREEVERKLFSLSATPHTKLLVSPDAEQSWHHQVSVFHLFPSPFYPVFVMYLIIPMTYIYLLIEYFYGSTLSSFRFYSNTSQICCPATDEH